jgi:hypothetical protein
MPAKELTFQDIKTILAAAIGIKEWNVDDVSDGFVYYTQDASNGITSVRGTYKRSYTITESQAGGTKVNLGEPVQVVKRTLYEPLVVVGEFSLDDSEVAFTDGEMVTRTGKVFEAGSYPDKDFSITEEELAQVPITFTPVDNDLEHKPTILSGRLGQLKSVVAKGKELFGTVAIPKWLNETIGSDPLKVSLAWAKNSKRIVGNALVLNPRVPDAQLVAAFNAANQSGGGDNMPVTKKKLNWWEKLCSAFAANKLPEGMEDFKPEQVAQFADEEPAAPAEKTETKPVSESAKFAADLDTERKKNAGLEVRLIQSEAATFVDEAIKAGKIFPAERDSLIAQFTQVVKDDARDANVACFSDDGALIEGSRVKMLRESIEKRPEHHLFSEQIDGIGDEELVVLSRGGAGKQPSKDRMNDLRAKSGLPVKE